MKKALITGVTGQDGSYLAEFLLEKGYEVHGMVRSSSSFNRGRIDHLFAQKDVYNKRFFLHYADLADASSLIHTLARIRPQEVYNLAAQSHVKISFEIPEYTAQVDALGTLRVLEAIRQLEMDVKFYQASTSELYGNPGVVPQSETTPFSPRSPYAAAKLYAYWLTKNYREAYGIFGANGILFNHESPRRGENFVTRKITLGVARLALGDERPLKLGNLQAKRDWGYAPEFVDGMWRMLQLDQPDDFVLATGISKTVKDFVDAAFAAAELEIVWEGEGADEKAFFKNSGKVAVEIDPEYYRPLEVDYLLGDASKAKKVLNWEPQTKFEDLVRVMVKSDIEYLSSGRSQANKLRF